MTALGAMNERVQANAVKSGIPGSLISAVATMDFYDVLMDFEDRNRKL